jgi:hypothetical protein
VHGSVCCAHSEYCYSTWGDRQARFEVEFFLRQVEEYAELSNMPESAIGIESSAWQEEGIVESGTHCELLHLHRGLRVTAMQADRPQ